MLHHEKNRLETKNVKKILIGGVILSATLQVAAGAYALFVWHTVKHDKNRQIETETEAEEE